MNFAIDFLRFSPPGLPTSFHVKRTVCWAAPCLAINPAPACPSGRCSALLPPCSGPLPAQSFMKPGWPAKPCLPATAKVPPGVGLAKLLYGVIDLDEADFTATPGCSALQAASQEAYRRIFRLLDAKNLPHLWRVWNYLAAINRETDGLERYRQFNIGRQDAFEFGAAPPAMCSAACAIGLTGGPLSIGSCWRTSRLSPSRTRARSVPTTTRPTTGCAARCVFARRAGLSAGPGNPVHFRYGEYRRPPDGASGDVAGQCREALANVAAVLGEANRLVRSTPYTLPELSYRVWLLAMPPIFRWFAKPWPA